MKLLSLLCGIVSVLFSSASPNLFTALKSGLSSSDRPKIVNDPMAFQALSIASFSYCMAPQIKKFTCEDCDDRSLVLSYQSPLSKSQRHHSRTSQVVIVSDHRTKQILVGFRGSRSAHHWMKNWRHQFTNWHLGRVYSGFHRQFIQLVNRTVKALLRERIRYPYYPIIMAGHSTGGSLAMMMGSYLAEKYPKLTPSRLYTFGTPRTGDAPFANLLQHVFFGKLFRIINKDDMMGDVPPVNLEYFHTGVMVECSTGTVDCIYGVFREDHSGPVKSVLDTFDNESRTHWVYLGENIREYECT